MTWPTEHDISIAPERGLLPDLLRTIENLTTRIVVHPDNADALRSAVTRVGLPLVEIHASSFVPKGQFVVTAHGFPWGAALEYFGGGR